MTCSASSRVGQHESLEREAAYNQLGEQRQCVGGGLAAPGLGLGDEVATLQRGGQARRLDGGHLEIAESSKVLPGSGGERE